MRRSAELTAVMEEAGIVFDSAIDFLPRTRLDKPVTEMTSLGPVLTSFGGIDMSAAMRLAQDAGLALDAPNSPINPQPGLVTVANAGIPSFLTMYVDPKLIEVLYSPLKAAASYGEARKGDWLMETAMFAMIESTGEVSSYGDFATNGRAGANAQWPQRQAYLYQVFTEWGERELERMGLARVDWAARLNIASALTLNRFQNTSYFFGINGLQNYGALNDPSLSALLTPTSKMAGGTGWAAALPTEILADFQKVFAQLQTQTGSNLEMDTPMTALVHSISEVYLANTNSFGLTAEGMIKKVFPNLKIMQAPQLGYPTGATTPTLFTMQMWVDELEGQRTIECSFNEKMRAHRIVQDTSSWRQKKTQGTWGAIVYRPACVSGLTGI
jgi:hypothetical protein